MAFFDRVFGRTALRDRRTPARSEDETAVDRYQQVLANAPTEKIQQVHLEAFSRLTPAQLDIVFERFTQNADTPEDRPSDARPATLAKTAARAERHQPGTLSRTLGGGLDGAGSRSVLGTVAGYVIASEIVSAYLWSGLYAEPSSTHTTGATGAGPNEESPGIFDGGGYEL